MKTNKPHKHAALIKMYLEAVVNDPLEYKQWEWRHPELSDTWRPLLAGEAPTNEGLVYRRKPRTININGFEIPEPLREVVSGQEVYIVTGYSKVEYGRVTLPKIWSAFLRCGFTHSTREAAELHAKALLSFTQQKD